jgi:cell division protein ZapA
MSALMIADELLDANQRIMRLQEQVDALQDARFVAAERAKASQSAISAALNSAAERLERMTQALNRTLGGGVAIG